VGEWKVSDSFETRGSNWAEGADKNGRHACPISGGFWMRVVVEDEGDA
jgi:hypothetical protein